MAENNPAEIPRTTLPRYAREAAELALQLATLTTEELERMLRTNRQIAATNRRRYRQFHGEEALPALLAYTGVVFRHIAPERFTPGDFEYAQQHLNITSFLYGLLRPLDAIRRYRLEGDAVLPGHDDQTMFGYWQGRLTEAFLEKIHADDGILVNLASSEMKRLFDWKRIRREARIITPEFRIREGDRLKTIVVYTKMCRGEMTRHLIRNRIADPERIRMGRVPVRRRAQPGRRLDVHDVTRPQETEEEPSGSVSLPLVDEQEPVRPVTASFGQPPFERMVVAGDLLPRAHVARLIERRHRSAVGTVGGTAVCHADDKQRGGQ